MRAPRSTRLLFHLSHTDFFPGKSKSPVGAQLLCWGRGRNNHHSCQLSQPLGLLSVQILGEVGGMESLLETRSVLPLNCGHLQRHADETKVVFCNRFFMTPGTMSWLPLQNMLPWWWFCLGCPLFVMVFGVLQWFPCHYNGGRPVLILHRNIKAFYQQHSLRSHPCPNVWDNL